MPVSLHLRADWQTDHKNGTLSVARRLRLVLYNRLVSVQSVTSWLLVIQLNIIFPDIQDVTFLSKWGWQ